MKTLANFYSDDFPEIVEGVHQQELDIPSRPDIVARVVACTINSSQIQHFWYELWNRNGEKAEDCVGKRNQSGSIIVRDVFGAREYISRELEFFKGPGARKNYIDSLQWCGILNLDFERR